MKINYRMIEGKWYESCSQVAVPYFGKMIKYCGRPWSCPACTKEQDIRIATLEALRQ